MNWRAKAACRGQDPKLFHPKGGPVTRAKRICHTCPVKSDCLAWVLSWEGSGDERHGIFAELTADERRHLYDPKAA